VLDATKANPSKDGDAKLRDVGARGGAMSVEPPNDPHPSGGLMHFFTRRGHHRAVLAAIVLCAACERPQPTDVNGARLAIEPTAEVQQSGTSATLTVGASASLVPYSLFAQRRLAWGDTLTWTSKAASIVTVTKAGMATAIAVGKTIVIVTYRHKSDTIPVTVTAGNPAPVASVSASLAPSPLSVGQGGTLTAVARDAAGQVISGATFTYQSSAPAIASIAADGSVSALAQGTVTLTATSGGVAGSLTTTVNAAAPPPPTSIPLPSPPTILSYSYPSVTGKTWVVKPTDNLQTIINNASRGDEIVLPAGVTFTGHFTLPVKAGSAANGWVIIRSDKSHLLPPPGTRVTKLHAPLMARLMTPDVAPVMATNGAASGYWLSGLEMTVVSGLTYINYGLVFLGDGTTSQNSLTRVPQDIVIERSYIHGDPNGKLSRCIALNSGRTAILDSYLHECHLKGFDSQAIAGWNGPGPFKIVNNTLVGAGENILFGGADPHIQNLIPADIEIRRNYIYTPASWSGIWTRKNLFELKNARRVLLEGNVLDGAWRDGQTGFGIMLKVTNQGGGCRWCTTSDVTIRHNIMRNVGAGFSIQGKEGGNPNPIGGLLDRLLIEENIVENVNVAPYLGEARLISMMQNPQNVVIRRNTMTSTGALSQYLNLAGLPAGTNFNFLDNVVSYGTYGLFSSWYQQGENNAQAFQGNVSFNGTVMIGAFKNGYPNGSFVSTLSAALATGKGAPSAIVSAATQGVVIP
jgi:Bacterial Ig-like domain (group 2)